MSMLKIAALIPVCALFAACGGEATPEAKAPEGGDSAAATESKPAEGDAAKPAEGEAAPPAGDAAPADAKPAEGEAK